MKTKILFPAKAVTYISSVWIVAGLLLTGLSADEKTLKSSSSKQLQGTHWRLVEFQSMDDATGIMRPSDPAKYTMSLNSDGSVNMRLNCNYANGNWTSEQSSDGKSGHFEFGPIASTRAFCPPPSMDGQIVAQAQYIRSYLLKDGKLYLSLMADGGIYAWEPDTGDTSVQNIYASPDEGRPRNWEVTGFKNDMLNLREEPSTKAKIIDRYPLGTILDNLGCQSIEGHIWCDVQKLGGGARGYVSSKFLKPAISPDGSAAMGPDDSALRAGQGDFDATGDILCTNSVDKPMTDCKFGVARAGGGYSTIVIKKPDTRTRMIYFRMGKPIGSDTCQADGYLEFRSARENDFYLISVGKEQYKIPEAIIFGD